MKVSALSLFLAFLLLSCASAGPGRKPESTGVAGTPGKLQFIFSGQRKQAALPCGCSMAPLGGVHREFNALKDIRTRAQRSIFLVGGPTFVDGTVAKQDRANNTARMDLLADMLNALDVGFYFPSPEDLGVESKELLGLMQKTKFPWVASNLSFKMKDSKITRFAEVELGEGSGKGLLLGVSRPAEPWLRKKNVRVEDPVTALKAIFAKQKPDAYSLVVVVSNLNQAGREKIEKAFPFVHLILGGTTGSEGFGLNVAQEGALRLKVEPEGEGKTMAFVDFPKGVPAKSVQFFSERTVTTWKNLEFVWKDKLYDLDRKISESKSARETSSLKKERAKWARLTAMIPDVTQKKEGATEYHAGVTLLGPEFDEPDSPLKPMMEKFRSLVPNKSVVSK